MGFSRRQLVLERYAACADVSVVHIALPFVPIAQQRIAIGLTGHRIDIGSGGAAFLHRHEGSALRSNLILLIVHVLPEEAVGAFCAQVSHRHEVAVGLAHLEEFDVFLHAVSKPEGAVMLPQDSVHVGLSRPIDGIGSGVCAGDDDVHSTSFFHHERLRLATIHFLSVVVDVYVVGVNRRTWRIVCTLHGDFQVHRLGAYSNLGVVVQHSS